jgi:glycosyltransferase involved in cell wall biosynthesis
MRLTLINQFYSPDISPTARLAASLASHRAAQGDHVTVVASRGGYVKRGDAAELHGNPRVLRLWTPQLGKNTAGRRLIDWATFYLAAVWRVIALPRQDAIISLTTPPYIALAAVFHKLLHPRVKLVLWNMDCYPDVLERTGHVRPGGWLSRLLRTINRMIFRQLDLLICLDRAMADLLLAEYSPRSRRIASAVIPNWESTAEFPPESAAPIDTGGRLALRPKFIVLYMGNAGYGHEFDTILSAAESLRNEPFTFLFVGGGARRAFIEQQRQSRKLDNVVLHDYVPEDQKRSVLASADCALITLADFALGVMSPSKLHANVAMGLPILYIGPPGSNVDDAIQSFGCGGSFRMGDVAGVTSFLRELRANPQWRADLRERARRAFEEAYSDRRTLPMFDEALLRIL